MHVCTSSQCWVLFFPPSPQQTAALGGEGLRHAQAASPAHGAPYGWVQGTWHEIQAGLGCANHGEALEWEGPQGGRNSGGT